MNSWKVIIATLVIYGTGVITGGLLVNYTIVRANVRPANRQQQPGMQNATPWQVRNRELVRRMERELNLTPAQRTNIDQAIIASQERTRNLWRPIVPQMNREMMTLHDQIRADLSPEQQKVFDDLVKQTRPARRPDNPGSPDRRPGNTEPAPAEFQATNAPAAAQ